MLYYPYSMASKNNKHQKHEAHIVAVDMGYGHERPAHSLKYLARDGEGVIVANNYRGIPWKDRLLWEGSRTMYETFSRAKAIPLIGKYIFGILDQMQEIQPFYPARDLSDPSAQTRQIYSSFKLGLGRDLIDRLRDNPVPYITTFFITAFMAEEFDYPGDIFCITTDTDISRAWAPLDPRKSRIQYFAATGRCVERLKLYGVREENIHLTGFPLPPDLIGGADADVAKKNLRRRLHVLDPRGVFQCKYGKIVSRTLGEIAPPRNAPVPTIMFAIGGAGAQKQLAVTIMHGLRHLIARGEIRLILCPGTRIGVAQWLERYARYWNLGSALGKNLIIFAAKKRKIYFEEFTRLLAETDILWTKPSELSFYTGLGLPIIASYPIGSQEEYNLHWLHQVGGGVNQPDPRYCGEWLVDWIESGALARMAWHGFVEAPTHGAYRIENIVFGKKIPIEELPLIV